MGQLWESLERKTIKVALGSMWYVGNFVFIMLDQSDTSRVAHLEPVKSCVVCH